MYRVYHGRVFLEKLLGPLENIFYRIARIDPNKEMTWQQYAVAVCIASLVGFFILFCILRFQNHLPLNPQHFSNINDDLAFNTAVSFITNTNWQSYSGESTLSYFSQMIGLTVQNFLSASMGMGIAVAFIRGIARRKTPYIGNFWVDWLRGILYILLPLSLLFSLILGSQGVIQNFTAYESAYHLENKNNQQAIPGGPVASQVAIKMLGSNGGGFFGTNAAHPFENPTPLSNFLQLISILLIPSAFCYLFGIMINDTRQAWAILIVMTIIFIPLMLYCVDKEQQSYAVHHDLSVDQNRSPLQSGGNMEGKEVRFGIVNSALWASATTATSNGSVNSMHDSYTPLGGLITLIFLFLSEAIYGGVGCGLYGIILFVIISVFIAGLMVGRTPEYLGKKIQSFEIKMAVIALFIPVILILFGAAITVLLPSAQLGTLNPGAHGFTEILYGFASVGGNNGSAFAGLSANTPFYNSLFGLIMLFSRFWVIIPVLAIAGSLAQKNTIPANHGTLSTHTTLFMIFLIGIILLGSLLTFIPAIILGPVTEYFEWIK